jgi:hypothetical protein
MDRLRQLLGRPRLKYEPVADTEMVTEPSSVSVHSIPSSALVSTTGTPATASDVCYAYADSLVHACASCYLCSCQ